MKGRALLLSVALGLGIMGTGALYYGKQMTTQLVPVVVAARDVNAREIVNREDLRVAMVSAAAVDPHAVKDPAQLIGKVLISPIFAGEQIRPQRVNPSELELAADEVAASFETDLVSAVGGMLQAGDVVDIYLSFNPAVTRRSDVKRLAEGIKVLSVRDSAARATGPRANADPSKPAGGTPAVVVVKLPANRVAELREAANTGKLIFALRSPNAPVPERPIFPAVVDLPKALPGSVNQAGAPVTGQSSSTPGTAPADPGQEKGR